MSMSKFLRTPPGGRSARYTWGASCSSRCPPPFFPTFQTRSIGGNDSVTLFEVSPLKQVGNIFNTPKTTDSIFEKSLPCNK